MPTTIPLTLLGFNDFERRVFESELRLSAQTRRRYLLEPDAGRAGLVVADADDAGVAVLLDGSALLGHTLAVGRRPLPGAALHLPRPLNPTLVIRALDGMAPAAPADPEPPPSPQVQRVLDHLALLKTQPPPRLDEVLVVDEDDRMLRVMAGYLGRLGFEIRLARSGAEALDRIGRGRFEFVFVAPQLQGIDGFQLCRAIRQLRFDGERRPPTLTLLARPGEGADHVRAAAVGCDACLELPLRGADLLRVVGAREVRELPFLRTGQSNTAF